MYGDNLSYMFNKHWPQFNLYLTFTKNILSDRNGYEPKFSGLQFELLKT